jgi:hypothetical protein
LNPKSSPQTLGKHIASFRGRPIGAPTWVFIFMPGVMIISGLCLYGIYLAVSTYQRHGPALAIVRSQAWILLATILFILYAAYLIYRLLVSLQRIQVFEAGLKVRRFFLQSRSYLWSDISGISSSAVRLTFFGKPINTTPGGKIIFIEGRSVDLKRGYQGIPRLIKILKSKVYPLIWPQIQSAIRSGKTYRFGRISINREAMYISNRIIPWDTVLRLYTDAGFLVVELLDDSSRKVPTINIPNLELLLKAVDWGVQ